MTREQAFRRIRSRAVWIGFFIAAYFTSALWCGRSVFTQPLLLLFYAPLGVVCALHCLGLPDSSALETVVLYGLHILFWPLFLLFLWRLPRLSASTFQLAALSFMLLVLVTLGGCSYMFGHTR